MNGSLHSQSSNSSTYYMVFTMHIVLHIGGVPTLRPCKESFLSIHATKYLDIHSFIISRLLFLISEALAPLETLSLVRCRLAAVVLRPSRPNKGKWTYVIYDDLKAARLQPAAAHA